MLLLLLLLPPRLMMPPIFDDAAVAAPDGQPDRDQCEGQRYPCWNLMSSFRFVSFQPRCLHFCSVWFSFSALVLIFSISFELKIVIKNLYEIL